MIKKLIVLMVFTVMAVNAQNIDVSEQLKQIKNGEIEKATNSLKKIRVANPDNPSVIFLDALLTKDGDLALNRYETIIRDYPQSEYVDASLYCVFSYHYALGNYTKAEKYLTELKTGFPNSPYIKNAERNLELPPDESISKEVKKKEVQEPIKTVEKEKTAEKEKPVEQVISGNYFAVQVGAFVNLERAKELADKIGKQNYVVKTQSKDVGGTAFHLVLVGEFLDKDKASKIVQEVNARFNVSGRVVTVTK